jgi:hypothetical protein
MNGSDLVNAEGALAAARRALRRNDDCVVESTPRHGGVIVTITRPAAPTEVLNRAHAEIEISGAGFFNLVLDGRFGICEIDDNTDSWFEIFNDFVELADVYLDGGGVTRRTRLRWGRFREDLVLEVHGDSYLLEGRTHGFVHSA